ncbi:hypothetical protein SCP_0602870 [Sparassis crispa]|uniref:Uncharacterized protein n=1 Tax=Sparassis crispa TaxID=139825 RepID=A0A401GQ86_9APHY|nr:hypothetical protein SCP_0602870 [Sparassis crispa]GBE84309.1 hypothetical protein SCP_0602870 [Sparassis crispa]
MSHVGDCFKLPPYSSRSLYRYHPYPRVQRRLDEINSIPTTRNDDNNESPAITLSPILGLYPVDIVGADVNDDVSTLMLDDHGAGDDEPRDEGRRERPTYITTWVANAVATVWRKCQALCTPRLWPRTAVLRRE